MALYLGSYGRGVKLKFLGLQKKENALPCVKIASDLMSLKPEISEALDEACALYGEQGHRKENRRTRSNFLHRLRIFLDNIPEDTSIQELRDEIGEADTNAAYED